MERFSTNYHLRKFYLENDQVPTQSTIKRKMHPALAAVYFKSMGPSQKVLAGFEPPMNGGGSDWYVPPKDLLEGNAVLKPLHRKYLKKLNHKAIIHFGQKSGNNYRRYLDGEINKKVLEDDNNKKNEVIRACHQQWEDLVEYYIKFNTDYIRNAFDSFSSMYQTSFNNFEALIYRAATMEIKKTRDAAFHKMQKHYEDSLKLQAIMLTERYTEKLKQEKARLKAEFIENYEMRRTEMGEYIHDLNIDKHVAVEKLKKLLECQNLACQVYVALKEREEMEMSVSWSKYAHEKKLKILTENIALKDVKIRVAEQKEFVKPEEFNLIWQKKVCHVVRKFQMLVSYCLNMLPEHAEFFINVEKLMLLQVNEALEKPTAESIILEEAQFDIPRPKPHPFYLFCDRGYKPHVDQDLCPKHCTSSASQLPVIVVNKRCLYAACDNFQQFTNKVKDFVHGKRGDHADFRDDVVYDHYVPVKYTESQQLLELKLESSLLQILQQDMSNIKQLSLECAVCKRTNCACDGETNSFSKDYKESTRTSKETKKETPFVNAGSETSIPQVEHEREPKWESYFEYIVPKKCACAKTAKKHLIEHLPAYMRRMSKYEAPDLPNYERCPITTLEKLVKNARGYPSVPPLPKVPSKNKDVGTQYSDPEFDWLCTCLADSETVCPFKRQIIDSTYYNSLRKDNLLEILTGLPTYMKQQPSDKDSRSSIHRNF